GFEVVGWLISLGSVDLSAVFRGDDSVPTWIRVDSGAELEALLGKRLFNRLLSIKAELRTMD
ncbi:MAG: hypothetical protein ACTSWN_16635, partial [Promethearchaeota archaeon]